jgi:HEAT repeat protein
MYCPNEPSANVSWREAWIPPIVQSIFELWGSSAAGSGLMMDNNLIQEQAAAWLAGQEPEDMLGALPALISALETSAGEARAQVAGTIAKIGPPAKDAFPTLLEILEHAMELDEKSPVSVNMSMYGYAVETAMASIAGITRANAPDDVRFWQLWWEAQELVEAGDIDGLLAMMEDEADPWAIWHAADALGTLSDTVGEAIPALIEALNHPNEDVRKAAVRALGRIGLEDQEAMRALVSKLDDRDIGLTLRNVLREIDLPAIPALIEKASENKGEPSHYTNASKYALDILKSITGEDYDGSAWATYKWTQAVDDFLARCWDYYHAQGGE